jgi:hypothetical protein
MVASWPESKGWVMKSRIAGLISGLFCAGMLHTGMALACDPIEDGCLGCNDDELPVCLNEFVDEICLAGGGLEYCNRRRAFKDVERQVTLDTGRHMSHVRAMVRSAHKYQTLRRNR